MSLKRKAISLETKYAIVQKKEQGVKSVDLMKEFSLADNDEKESDPEPEVSISDAIKGLQTFKLYMLQRSLDRRSVLKQVNSLENELKVKHIQSNIDSFFKFH